MGNKTSKFFSENRWLLAIIVLGAALRLYGLGTESFWLDESATVYSSQKSIGYIMGNLYSKQILVPEVFRQGGEMPLYFIMSYYWAQLFGISEFSLRLLPAIFGIVSIYLIYLAGKNLFNKKVGLGAAFILSINHQHIYYSQEARMYSLLVVLTLASFILFWKSLNKNSRGAWISYSLVNTLLIYTHYYSFFILASQAVYFFFFSGQLRKLFGRFSLSAAVTATLYVPWIPALFKQIFAAEKTSGYVSSFAFQSIIELLISFNSWISPDYQTRRSLIAGQFSEITVPGFAMIASVILMSAVFFLFFLLSAMHPSINSTNSRKSENFHGKNPLIAWLFVPLLIPFLASIILPNLAAFGPIRFSLFVTPAYYLMLSLFIFNYGAKIKWKRISGILRPKAVFSLIIILSAVPLYSYYANYDKPQYREAAAWLSSRTAANDRIIMDGAGPSYIFGYYYNKSGGNSALYHSFSPQELISFAKKSNDFWVVESMAGYYDPEREFGNFLDSNFEAAETKTFSGVAVKRYRSYSK